MKTNTNKIACDCSCGSSEVIKPKGAKRMSLLNIGTGVLFFLFPKCPFCWAAYASFFSFIGLDTVAYNSSWKLIILAIFLVGSLFVLWKHYRNKSWLNIILYTTGLGLLLVTYYLNFSQTWWLYIVAVLMLLSNLKMQKMNQRLGLEPLS
ncbi:MAG: hypothetical protein JKY22_01385 [Flavobacteriaceae bacterium]|nr:hypothetical protein [Flavobacteriaceae bacterium]